MQQGEEHYREALILAQELGMRPLLAQCNVVLGNCIADAVFAAGEATSSQRHDTDARDGNGIVTG